ncbi:MAG: type II toxin-antitoxin system PemK/MazF family toxin, partial [Geminicoccaceae bacterium]
WARLSRPFGSEPGFDRPVVIIQSNQFNRSRLSTVVAAAITSNLRVRDAPGNVYLAPEHAGLEHASVINVTQLVTVDRRRLLQRIGCVTGSKLHELEEGLRLVLAL